MSLTTRFEEQQDSKVIKVSLAGSLDANTAPIFEQELEPKVCDGIRMLVLDMKDLEYISSAGLRTVFKLSKRTKQLGGKLGVVNRQPQIVKVFDIVKALPDLNVFSSMDEMDEYLTIMQAQVVQSVDH